jgi:hypothetical protein
MARSKRQYGSGCLLKRGKGWAIRWREIEIAPDGTKQKVLRYEALGEVSRKQATNTLAERMSAARTGKAATRPRVTFRTVGGEWDDGSVLQCTNTRQRSIVGSCSKALLPQFGDTVVSEVTRQWMDIDEQARMLTVREAVYDGTFGTPKTNAGRRQIPLSDTRA